MEAGGAGLLLFALFMAVSFLTYHAEDPSFNYAADGPVRNWAGTPGAYLAEPLLEMLGFAAIVLVVIPLAWGWKMVRKESLSPWWLRITMLAIVIPVSASFFTSMDLLFDVPESWLSDSFGGVLGAFIYDDLYPYTTPLGFALVTLFFFLTTLFFTLGLHLGEWKAMANRVIHAIVLAWQVAAFATRKAIAVVQMVIRKAPKAKAKKVTKAPSKTRRKIVEVARSATRNKTKKAEQTTLDLKSPDEFQLPLLSFLKSSSGKQETLSESALSQNAQLLEKVLDDFGVYGKITRVRPGPVVTLYELEPAPGTKSSRVIGLSDDIARSMSAVSARIAVIPGQNAIGIELPNDSRETVLLRELLESETFKDEKHILPLALGKDIGGDAIIGDLGQMPHLLVAGTTGSGKSVALNTMIISLLYRYSPEECRFIMIDPKMLELSVYDGIPHLLSPVVTEPSKAIVALKWTVKEMENRYRLMSHMGVRNIANYNQRIKEARDGGEVIERNVQTGFDPETGKPIIEAVPLDMTPLPLIVVVVDEMADLMIISGKDIETSIQRLAQMARAAGIHIIMATQRPSVDVITGVIKANFPTRISFQVTSRIDSRTILGEQGAEQLLGKGDMLYMSGGSRITRVHGPFISDKEVEKVVSFLKKQAAPDYIEEVTAGEEEFDGAMGESGERDAMYDRAVEVVCREQRASTSFVQRALKIGYNRAANIIEQMERDGVVSPANHSGKREVLVTHVPD